MIRKTAAALLLAAVLTACAAGCGPETPAPESLPDISNGSENAESSLLEETGEPSEEESKPLQTEPVVLLDCFEGNGITANLLDAGDNRVAVMFGQPAEVGEADWEMRTTFCLVDLAENRIVYRKEDVGVEDVIGIGPNGEAVVLNYLENEIQIYNADFSLARAVKLEDYVTPLFDRKSNSVYCIDGEKLLKIGLDGGQEELARLPGATGLAAYDPESGVALLFDGDVDEETSGQGEITAYSVTEGRVLRTVDASGTAGKAENGIWLISTSVAETDTVVSSVRLFDPESGWTGKRYALPEDGYLSELGETGFGYWVSYGFDIESRPTCRMIDLNTGRAGGWKVGGEEEYVSEGLFVNGGRNLVCVTSDDSRNLKLYLTAPEMLEYPDALEEAEEAAGRVIPELPESLSEQRELADRIEEEYSVRILIGEQCKISENSFTYDLIPTDGDKKSDRKALTAALQLLEKTLALYPGDFFRTFRNYRDAGGIRFVMTDDLRNSYGSFDPAGVANYMDGWYNIAFDVNVISVRTIHHEIWHEVEERILAVNRNAIDEEEWASQNPPGFEYLGGYEDYTEQKNVLKHTLPVALKDACFVEMYSATRPQEDRATLIEEILSDNYEKSFYGEPDPLTLIRSCPRLKAKLALLEEPTLRVFGTVYWEDIVSKTYGGET